MGRRKLSEQIEEHSMQELEELKPFAGNEEVMISTGSTLLDLAISGGRVRGGGIPSGILVEIFGPSGTGKTVLLCEIAGNVVRQGGQIMFRDPEARLNKQFAKLFGLNIEETDYDIPATVAEVFEPVRKWNPEPKDKVHGIFVDSLAALTTEWEADGKDQYGMRRAKEFSEQLRLTCRTLKEKNFLMVCSNQVRQNLDAGPYGQRYKAPGGEAVGFYSSLRLRCVGSEKITEEKTIKGKKVKKVVGVKTEIEVFKSSVWKPYNRATISIIYDYGIDDIKENLQFLKSTLGTSVYELNGRKLSNSLKEAIKIVEADNLEDELKNAVIDLWIEIEKEFESDRKLKVK